MGHEPHGPPHFRRRDEQVFLGKELAVHQDYSEKTAIEIDKAVHDIVMECYKKARDILETNLDGLKLLADALLERETLVTEEIDEISDPDLNFPRSRLYDLSWENTHFR